MRGEREFFILVYFGVMNGFCYVVLFDLETRVSLSVQGVLSPGDDVASRVIMQKLCIYMICSVDSEYG
jgi:hypothetical protein